MPSHANHTERQEMTWLWTHILIYLVANATFLVLWKVTGAPVFWPAIPMLVWGTGVVAHAMMVMQGREWR